MKNVIPQNQPAQLDNEKIVLQELISSCLLRAKKLGASAAQIAASKNRGLEVNVRMGEVDTVEFTRDNSVNITVYFGQRCGVASTTDFSEDSLHDTLRAACDIAKSTAEDLHAGLADRELMAYNYPELNLCFPWQLETHQAIELAKNCETVGRESDNRIVNSDGVSISTHQGTYAYGNSHGFVGAYPWSRHSLSCVLVAKDQQGKMQRDSEYTVNRDPKKLRSFEQTARDAASRTVNRLGARPIKTSQVPVIFAAEIASQVLSTFISAISGSNLYRRSSFLVDSLNKTIFPTRFHVVEDPLMQDGLGSVPFDAEGVVTKKRNIISSGQLLGYVLNSYTARKLGLTTTANAGGVHNIIFNSDDMTHAELLTEMQTGLIVTDMMGNGINLTTGDFSQGASGFWVEQGVLQFPVEGITIAGNLRDMFMNIRAMANDIDHRHNILSGSLLIDGITIAGT